MSFVIQADELVEPGVYDAVIEKVELINAKYGERLKISFMLDDDSIVTGFFPPRATRNNKTGRLFEIALGELRPAKSDELIGKSVKVFVEHVTKEDRIYADVSKIA